MGVEGIGASVVRKEDRRFITGRGRYVDDIKLQGMTFAQFVRSPHAHAKVKSIDSSEAMKMPGDGAGDGALCRTGGRGGDCRDQEPGQGRGGSRRDRLRSASRSRRY